MRKIRIAEEVGSIMTDIENVKENYDFGRISRDSLKNFQNVYDLKY